jgi:RNA polymerase sigma-70 factor (ECF subfamily)
MSSPADEPTSTSLLKQLRQSAGPQAGVAWSRFVRLYTPLLFLWARRLGAGANDAEELVQDVFAVLAREMPTFRHEPTRRFRGWLWTIVRNRWCDQLRRRAAHAPVASPEALANVPGPDNVEEMIEAEYRTHLIRRALEIMRAELPAQDWRACEEYVLGGRPAADVARELGMSLNQVYVIKSRLLRRVREELDGLLD